MAVAALSLGCGARSSLSLEETSEEPIGIEQCNGVDDDGDGLIDEDIAMLSCGVGECRRERPGCEGGVVPSCEPGEPSAEVCDNLDNDCDGAVDEELGFGPIAGPHLVAPIGGLWLELLPLSDGMLAVYNQGFNGSNPTPSLIARKLDADGIPIGPAHPLLERSISNGPTASPSHDGGYVLTYCGRFGTDDAATSAYVDANGQANEHGERSPKGRSCGASEPAGLWTGSHHLFSWTDNSSGPIEGFETLLDIADPNGSSLDWRTLYPDGELSAPPRMAVSGNRVALVTGFRSEPTLSELAFYTLDGAGAALGPPLTFGPPVADGGWGDLNVATAADGSFVALLANRSANGLLSMRVSANGQLLKPPTLYPGIDWRADYVDFVARPSGGFLAAGGADKSGEDYRGFVLALADDGSITHQWFTDTSSDNPYFAFADIATVGSRVFVFYATSPDNVNAELRVLEFGCVQPEP